MSIFRETPLPDGKPGPVSWRRVASAILLAAAIALFVQALALAPLMASAPWAVFIPGALCLIVSALMPILTTIADVKAIIHAVKGKPLPEEENLLTEALAKAGP